MLLIFMLLELFSIEVAPLDAGLVHQDHRARLVNFGK